MRHAGGGSGHRCPHGLLGGAAIAGQPACAIVARGLALSPEGWRLFVRQTVEQNVLLGATVLKDRSHIPHLLDRAGTLSGGKRQMLATGRTLISDPRLLMPDEPTLGLAPAVVESRYETLRCLRGQRLALLLAEQAVELALEGADHGYVPRTGGTVLEAPASELAQDADLQRIHLGLETPAG